MGQLRTGNKRRKRAALNLQNPKQQPKVARKTHPKPVVVTG